MLKKDGSSDDMTIEHLRALRLGPAKARSLAVMVGAFSLLAPSALAYGQLTHNDKGGQSPSGTQHGQSQSDKGGKAASGSDEGQRPAGNNGHIQIDEFSMDGGNGNDPHVACGFSVSFFGYDAGTQNATVTVTPWSPTSGGTPFSVTTSWTTAVRTSGSQLDQNVPISAASIAAAFANVAPAHQGYHAKVDVEVTGSQGNDGKHHTIWIRPCGRSVTSVDTEEAAESPVAEAAEHDMAHVTVTELERSGTTGVFSAGPITAALGSTVQYEFIVSNAGTTAVTETLRTNRCDQATLTPSGPQTIAAGGQLIYYCTHVLIETSPATIAATSAVVPTSSTGTSATPAKNTVLVRVRHRHLAVKSLVPASPSKPVVRAASFTG